MKCSICGGEIELITTDDGTEVANAVAVAPDINGPWTYMHPNCEKQISLWRRIQTLEERMRILEEKHA